MTFRSWGDLSRGRLAAFAACQYRHPSGNNSSLHVLCSSGTGALDAEGFVTRHGRGVWTYDVVGDIPGLGATTSLDIRRRGPKGPCCNSGRCKTCKPRECRDLGGTGNGRGGFLGDPGSRKGRSKPAHNHRWFGARRAWIIHHEPRGVRVGRLDPAVATPRGPGLRPALRTPRHGLDDGKTGSAVRLPLYRGMPREVLALQGGRALTPPLKG